ncbi:MAG: aminoacyl-tRNA hydrolase [Candidatus Gastranaerophilales bacterium]|jgi:PTH1 family peptidyl-tRNA hydrolase|nr:aminoacyl-tRNA hydrolase [Candidatus Gastranaerophilales bacterium]
MKLIVGLGNPGAKYENTRHNIGFMAVSHLAEANSIQGKTESKFNAIVGKGKIADTDVVIAQPLTYMNLSGQSVSSLMSFYKISKDDILVVYDDIALDLGVIRFRPSGSDGGHNGIKSIIQHTGGDSNFARLKIGIGPQPQFVPSENFVLQKFTPDEAERLKKIIPICSEAIEYFLKNGVSDSMNRYNGGKIE